jgi:uncharacterized protein
MKVYLKCIPDAYVRNIRDIDYKNLKKQGINALFFDLDNTIISYKDEMLDDDAIQFLNNLKVDFKIVIISNSGKTRVDGATKNSGFDTVSSGMKPTKSGFKRALLLADANVDETCVIGDQLMTDIFGAKRMGFHAILVKAVSRKTDRWMTKINRMIEKKMLKKIMKKEPILYKERLKAYVEDN